jgi:hypothetical protein
MSRKDYKVFADMFAKAKGNEPIGRQLADLLNTFCDYLETDNPNFDRERFLLAYCDRCKAYEGGKA